MADEGLLIPIQFSLEEARAALAQLEAQARAAGVRTGSGVSKGVEEGLVGLKKSMGPARQSAMFFTQALGEFGPQGRTAQIALSGVAGVIMGGGGVLAALSLAQVGARLLADAWGQNEEAAKKAAEEAKKSADEIAQRLKEARERVQQEIFKLSETSVSDIYKKTTLDPAVAAFKEMEAEVLGSAARLAKAKRAGDLDEYSAWSARLERAKAQLPALRAVAQEYERTWAVLQGQEQLKGFDDAASKGREAEKAAVAARLARMKAALAALGAEQAAYETKRQAIILAAEEAGYSERERAEIEYRRNIAGLEEWDTAAREGALRIRNAKLKGIDDAHYETAYGHYYDYLNKKARAHEQAAAEEIRKEEETRGAIMAIAQVAAQELLTDIANSLIHADLVNRRYNAQFSALSNAQRAQMLLQKGTAKSLAEAQVMVAAEASAAKAAEAAATKASEAEKLKAMAIGWALQGAVMAIPGPQFNPVAAAVYLGAAAAAGTAAVVLSSEATSQAQGRGFTAQENDSLASLQGGSTSASGARGYSGSGSSSGGGTITKHETVYVIGDPFESPAETARRAARVMQLADQLDMTRRAV